MAKIFDRLCAGNAREYLNVVDIEQMLNEEISDYCGEWTQDHQPNYGTGRMSNVFVLAVDRVILILVPDSNAGEGPLSSEFLDTWNAACIMCENFCRYGMASQMQINAYKPL